MSSPTLASTAPPADLVPLRIDTTSEDGQIRVIDTLLMDLGCWPVSVLLEEEDDGFEQNIQELAHSIIADSEVIGMGRTVRHFTNRTELWSKSLQNKVADQIRSQMRAFLERKLRHPPPSSSSSPPKPPPNHHRIIKIALRLTFHGVLLHDDFDWDTSIPMCPIQFAQSVADDLNLPPEAAIAIATSIVEQLHGIPIDAGKLTTRTVAVPIDAREQVANVAQAVAIHRPTTATATITNTTTATATATTTMTLDNTFNRRML